MIGTLRTLILGVTASAEDRVRDVYAIELIDQKIREAESSLKAAKATLASLIQRQRAEARMVHTVTKQIAEMTDRATLALDAGREDMATQAADAIAAMENERAVRQQTLDRLDQKIARLRNSVEAGQRRIVDLRQGAISARAVRREQQMQTRLNATLGGQSSVAEAEELIAKVLEKDDPFEHAEIVRDIEAGLTHDGLADRMAAQGFGPATKITGADVLARLKTKS